VSGIRRYQISGIGSFQVFCLRRIRLRDGHRGIKEGCGYILLEDVYIFALLLSQLTPET